MATDASAFVCYITRFTEENFATLIAFIFIKKAVEKLIHIEDDFPIEVEKCFCKPNETLAELWGVTNSSPIFDKIEHDDNDGKKLKHANHFECEVSKAITRDLKQVTKKLPYICLFSSSRLMLTVWSRQ